MAGASAHDSLLPRQPGGMAPGAALAVLAHVGLLFALTAAVDWRLRKPEVTASAELWASVPQVAAPRPAEPPAPAPAPAPRPAPTPAPAPPPPAPAPAPAPPQRSDADIALERDKRQQLERDRQQREQEALRVKQDKERERLAEAAKRREAEAEAKRIADAEAAKKKRETEAREAREAKAEEARLAQQREENLKRMLGQAGGPSPHTGTGAPNSAGTAAVDAAPSANYGGRLVALIRPNIVFTGSAEANAAAEVEVRAGPSGTIISRRLLKPSGQPDWDDAVLRAIDRTARLPRDSDGRVPPVIVMVFKPRE
jgi:colicin import membrane protein